MDWKKICVLFKICKPFDCHDWKHKLEELNFFSFQALGSLEEVAMPQNGIYAEGITALAEAFAENKNLRVMNLSDNTFTQKGAKNMAKVSM